MHCHYHMHSTDGMGFLLHEPGNLTHPANKIDAASLAAMPACTAPKEEVACACEEMVDGILHHTALSSYTCTRPELCLHVDPRLDRLARTSTIQSDDKIDGRPWRYGLAAGSLALLALLYFGLHFDCGRRCSAGDDKAEERNKRSFMFARTHTVNSRIDGSLDLRRRSSGVSRRRSSAEAIDVQALDQRPSPHMFPQSHLERDNGLPNLTWSEVGVSTPSGKELLAGANGLVYAGQTVGIIGKSGAGKSTFLSVIGNRELHGGAVATGTVTVAGNDARSIPPKAYREAVRFATQHVPLPGALTVLEHLTFTCLVRKAHDDSTTETAVEYARQKAGRFGLNKVLHVKIAALSGGQQKRVATAVEMIKPSIVTILDEPFSGLDSTTILDLYRSLKQSVIDDRSALVMTLHTTPPQVFDDLDYVLIFHNGQQVWFGPPASAKAYFTNSLASPCREGWALGDHFVNAVSRIDYETEEADQDYHRGKCCAVFDRSSEKQRLLEQFDEVCRRR